MTTVYQTSATTHWRNLFESKSMLLGAHNLNEGEELVATIASASIQSIKNQNGKDERVPVITFANNVPPMVLNITNTKTIAALYGDLYENWIGRDIQVYATMVKAFGKEQMALRVRLIVPVNKNEVDGYAQQLFNCQNLDELKRVYMSLPNNIKGSLSGVKDKVKVNLGG